MNTFREGHLEFSFGEQWQPVIDFDGHPDYKKLSNAVAGTKGVDFVGIFKDELNAPKRLYLIEVKDFRDYRIENQERLRAGLLAVELGQKVQGALACIISAYRTGDSETWQPFLEMLVDRGSWLGVVLWLEQDRPGGQKERRKAELSLRTKQYKKKLQWLTSRVMVCDQKSSQLRGLEVRNLPRPQID